MKSRRPPHIFSDVNYFQAPLQIPFLLLVIFAFLFKGTGDHSILLISYGVMLIAVAATLNDSWRLHSIQFSILTLLLVCWLIWIILPPVAGLVPNTAFFGIYQCSAWIFGFVLLNDPCIAKRWKHLMVLLWILGLVCAVYALIQLFFRNAMPTGLFASKNTAAAFLMTVNLLLMGNYFTLNYPERTVKKRTKTQIIRQKIIYLMSIFLITLALFAALSRGVMLCFLIFFLLEIAVCRSQLKIRNVYQVSAVLVLALVTLGFFAQPAIQHRLELLAHEKSRFIIWQGAWHLWQKTPWYGLGIFNFKHYYPAFSLPGDGSNLEYTHNDFLQLLIETGIPGMAILLGIIVTIIMYLSRYLNQQSQNPVAHIQSMACFAAFGALACHSMIDFNFYVFPMNLLMGCCLGYLHSFFKKEGIVRIYSSFLNIWILRCAILLFLVFISFYCTRFLILEHYIEKTETAIQTKQFNDALVFSHRALKAFPFVEVQSLTIDAYLQLIQQATSGRARSHRIAKTKTAINRAIAMNPYFARSYFQMALLHSLILDDAQKSIPYYRKALQNNPHFCLARLTFARLLIEQTQWHDAWQVLEMGLQYPIPPQFSELYLNYLAKLRFENGDQEGAKKIIRRLDHLVFYNQDYSDLS